MKIRAPHFIDFAYADKRKDKSKVVSILEDSKKDYDPAKDRYKKFRESLTSFEEGLLSEADFKKLHRSVAANKSEGYKVLANRYLDMKEDHGLVWDGRQPLLTNLEGLEISTSWYLHTDASNQKRIIFLNFQKNPLPRNHEKGLLTLLRLASPDSAGVGILNIQAATLVITSRADEHEVAYLKLRAQKFVSIASAI
jgi:hypothetical protein